MNEFDLPESGTIEPTQMFPRVGTDAQRRLDSMVGRLNEPTVGGIEIGGQDFATDILPSENPPPSLGGEFAAAARSMRQEQSAAMLSSVYSVADMNPDVAAAQARGAREFGARLDFFAKHESDLRRRLLLDEIEKQDLPETAPVLAEQLADPTFAAVAADDTKTLAKEEGIWNWISGQITGIPSAFMHGRTFSRMSEYGGEQIVGDPMSMVPMFSKEDVETQRKRFEEFNRELEEYGTPHGIALVTADMIGMIWEQAHQQMPTVLGGVGGGAVAGLAGIETGPGVAVTVTGGALAGAGLAYRTTSVENSFRQTAGMIYGRALMEGVDADTARSTAIASGLVLAPVHFAMHKMMNPAMASGADKAAAQALLEKRLAEAVATPTMRAAMGRIAKDTGGAALKLTALSVAQASLFEIANEVARGRSGMPMRIESEEGRDELVTAIVDNTKYMVLAGAGMQVLMPGASNPLLGLARERAVLNTARRQGEFFDMIMDVSKQSKLMARSPDEAEALATNQLRNTSIETILISKEGIKEAMDRLGLPMSRLDDLIPGAGEQFADPARGTPESGGFIELSTARFKAKIAQTELGRALTRHVTFSADVPTIAQSEKIAEMLPMFEANKERWMAETTEAIEHDQAFEDSATRVADKRREELIAAGHSEEDAATGAMLLRRFIRNAANDTGMTPEQFHARFPVHIEAEAKPEPAEPKAAEPTGARVQAETLTKDQSQQQLAATTIGLALHTAYRAGKISELAYETAKQRLRNIKSIDDAHGLLRSALSHDNPEYANAIAGHIGVNSQWERTEGGASPEYMAQQTINVLERLEREASEKATVDRESRVPAEEPLVRRSEISDAVQSVAQAIDSHRKLTADDPRAAQRVTPFYDRIMSLAVQVENALAARDDGELSSLGKQITRLRMESQDPLRRDVPKGISRQVEAALDRLHTVTYAASLALRDEKGRLRAEERSADGEMRQDIVTPKQDADYMGAVERGDTETAQRMVDEAAKAAGYTVPVYHFTDSEFTAFDIQRGQAGPGIWLTSSPEGWSGKYRLKLYLNPGQIETVKSQFDRTWTEGELSIESILDGDLATISQRNIDTLRNESDYRSTFYVATRPDQVKSAEPITRDAQGNVIPLSQRFNPESESLLYQDDVPTPAVSEVERGTLGVQRQQRKVIASVKLSTDEVAAIDAAVAAHGFDKAEMTASVKNTKRAHPKSAGWATVELVKVKKDDKGKPKYVYQQIPYAFDRNNDGKSLSKGTAEYQVRVDKVATNLIAEVRKVFIRAQNGDVAAQKILEQASWYRAMRSRLRLEFGAFGDLFADLLGATSPNTPVRDNWDNAIEALRRAMRGDYDALMPKWEAWADKVDKLETELLAWFNDEIASGKSKGEIKSTAEYQQKLAELKSAREIPEDLLPLKESGSKYGFNGDNVVRAFVELWRVIKDENPDIDRGPTAPKAVNFSGNLIGFRKKATIDVWAARLLQRLAGLKRIPSVAEGGVAGKMLASGETAGQFGFGQDVFAKATDGIRNDPQLNKDKLLANIQDDDLQAVVWFLEKEHWTINNWTSVAGEGGSFELEASLAGSDKRERIKELRRVIDAGTPKWVRQALALDITAAQAASAQYMQTVGNDAALKLARHHAGEKLGVDKKGNPRELNKSEVAQLERITKVPKEIASVLNAYQKAVTFVGNQANEKARAKIELKQMERSADRWTGGLSIEHTVDGEGRIIPMDAEMARVGKRIHAAINSDVARVIASRAYSTEGRYGQRERAFDIEFVTQANYDPREVWQTMVSAARDASQMSTFLSRVLRADEAIDYTRHRPGIELYLTQPMEGERLETLVQRLNAIGMQGMTIAVNPARTPEALRGEMPSAVGIRVQYIPEFADATERARLSAMSDADIAQHMLAKTEEWRILANKIRAEVEGVAYADVVFHDTQVAFASDYERILGDDIARPTEPAADAARNPDVVAEQRGGEGWNGLSVREGLEAADRDAREAARREPERELGRRDEGRGTEYEQSEQRAGDGRREPVVVRQADPLPDAPRIEGATGPIPELVAAAERYAAANGITLRRQGEYATVDTAFAERVAQAYDAMQHAPDDPRVREAYADLIAQTTAQYHALTEAGFTFYFADTENLPYSDKPGGYGNPYNAMRDLRENKRMAVYPTDAGFGSGATALDVSANPLKVDTGIMWAFGSPDGPLVRVTANDLFRAVHDAFGHGLEGAGFRARGEENAWQAHVRLFHGAAVGAMTSETRGQNSWLNFGPYGEKNRTAKVEDTVFADQKTGLMPEWTWTENRVGDMPMDLEQAAPRGPRGSFNPKTFRILLTQRADMSTFLHETGHYFLESYAQLVADGSASDSIKADFDIVLKWFGVKDAAAWQAMSLEQRRKHHEKFGYNFEIYLSEGRAPTIEMQGIFDRFASWLRSVYRDIRGDLNATYRAKFGEDLPILTGEVRQVMDRMLASEERIKQSEEARDMKAMFQTQEESGMNDAEWTAYKSMIQEAHDAAVTDLTKASIKQMQWLSNARSRVLRQMQQRNNDLRKAMRVQVEEEVRAEPVYRAMEFLKYGTTVNDAGERVPVDAPIKLDLAETKAILGEETGAKLGYGKYGMVQKDGMPVDAAAEMFGFKSGEELVRALADARKVKDEIQARTDERMLKTYGDLNDPDRMEEVVEAALHNEARARFVAVELRFLSKSVEPVSLMLMAAREAAREHVANRKLRDIRVDRFLAAEAKASRDAARTAQLMVNPERSAKAQETRVYNRAIAAGKDEATARAEGVAAGAAARANAEARIAAHEATYGMASPAEVARRAKQQQLFQHALAAEALDAKQEVEQTVRDLRKFWQPDAKIGKGRDIEMVMAARAILAYFGFGRSDKAPTEYIEQIKAFNPELYAELEPIIQRTAKGPQDYRDLTLTEFRAVRDAVEALWNDARRDKQIMVEGRRVMVEQAVGELVGRMTEIGMPGEIPGASKAPGRKEIAVRILHGVRAMMRRVEHWADTMDGLDNAGGPFTRYVFRPIKDALDAYRADRNRYIRRYGQLLAGLDIERGKIDAPEIGYTFGAGNGGVGKLELLGAMLHTGNESNLRKLLLGRNWGSLDDNGHLDTSRWTRFVNRMVSEGKLTKADFDFIQAVWDLTEELKPKAQKAHRDLYGYYFKEVEASPINTPFGRYRGGYVPAKADPFMSRDAMRHDNLDALESDFRQAMPSTGLGFTKARVEYNAPLTLDLRMIGTHIDDVLRFSHVQPAVKDVMRIFRDKRFSSALSTLDPVAMEGMLMPWLHRAAKHTSSTRGKFNAVDRFWSVIRARTSLMFMTLNLRQLGDIGGISTAFVKVRRAHMFGAMREYLEHPSMVAREIARLSPMMDERMNNQVADARERIEQLLGNKGVLGKAQGFAREHGLFLNTALHNQMDIVTWLGAYNQALEDIGANVSNADATREAVARADAAVRLTQGSLHPEDASAYESGTPFYRTITQFTTYLNTLANLNVDEYTKIIRELGVQKGAGKLIRAHLLAYAVPMIIFNAWTDLISGGWDDEDETMAEHVLSTMFGGYFFGGVGMLPFGSQAVGLAEGAVRKAVGADVVPAKEHIAVSPSLSALEGSVMGAAQTANKIATGRREVTGRDVKDVTSLISLYLGIPLTPFAKPIAYELDVERGKIKPTSDIDYIRGLITGSASPASRR